MGFTLILASVIPSHVPSYRKQLTEEEQAEGWALEEKDQYAIKIKKWNNFDGGEGCKTDIELNGHRCFLLYFLFPYLWQHTVPRLR